MVVRRHAVAARRSPRTAGAGWPLHTVYSHCAAWASQGRPCARFPLSVLVLLGASACPLAAEPLRAPLVLQSGRDAKPSPAAAIASACVWGAFPPGPPHPMRGAVPRQLHAGRHAPHHQLQERTRKTPFTTRHPHLPHSHLPPSLQPSTRATPTRSFLAPRQRREGAPRRAFRCPAYSRGWGKWPLSLAQPQGFDGWGRICIRPTRRNAADGPKSAAGFPHEMRDASCKPSTIHALPSPIQHLSRHAGRLRHPQRPTRTGHPRPTSSKHRTPPPPLSPEPPFPATPP